MYHAPLKMNFQKANLIAALGVWGVATIAGAVVLTRNPQFASRISPVSSTPSAVTPDARTHTATEVASGQAMEREPVNSGWTRSNQTCTVTWNDDSWEEDCEFLQDSDGTWYVKALESGMEFSYHPASETFLIEELNLCKGGFGLVFHIEVLGTHSVSCANSNQRAMGIAWDDNSVSNHTLR
jgi:hypothetical protein